MTGPAGRAAPASGRSRALPLAAGVALVTAAAYAPALRNGFVDWDDQVAILTNPHFRGLGPAQLRWMFTTFHLGPYQPLAWMSLGADYLIWGLRPVGYHLTSVLLHAASAAVLFLVARNLLSRGRGAEPAGAITPAVDVGAVAASLVFALHPLRVESVAWATERRDVLSGLLYLGSLLAYLRAGRATRFSIVLFVLGLLSKATAIGFPLVLLLLDVYPLGRWARARTAVSGESVRRLLAEKLPYAAAAAAAGAVALAGQHEARALRSLAETGIVERALIAGYATLFYVVKSVVPIRLSPLYALPGGDGLGGIFAAAAGAAVVLTALALAARRSFPGIAVAWASYLLLLAPVSGLLRIGDHIAADRYSYLATIPFALLAGAAVARIARARTDPEGAVRPGGRGARLVALAGLALLLVGLFARTGSQLAVWRDSISLWRHAVALDPQSGKARYSLGFATWRAGNSAEAAEHYRASLRLDPQNTEARNNLGTILAQQGDLDAARAEFLAAENASPRDATAQYNLGILARMEGKLGESRTRYERALSLRPDMATARINLAQLFHEAGDIESALRILREGLVLAPNDPRLLRAISDVERR